MALRFLPNLHCSSWSLVVAKSLFISRMVSNFYGTEFFLAQNVSKNLKRHLWIAPRPSKGQIITQKATDEERRKAKQ